jgi:tetratricopeptide (TPR) repeat protein
MAQHLEPLAARAQLQRALELEPTLQFDVDERMLSIARELDRQGVLLAEKLETARGAQRFEAATFAVDEKPYDYLGRASGIAIRERVEKGVDLAQKGETADAMNEFNLALQIDPAIEIDAVSWNELCWFGLVFGEAEDVIDACDKAVAKAGKDMNGFYADSRGVAHIVLGNTEDAIADFNVFLQWADDKPALSELRLARQEWIDALKRGDNPLGGLNLIAHSNWMSSFRERLGLGFYLSVVE